MRSLCKQIAITDVNHVGPVERSDAHFQEDNPIINSGRSMIMMNDNNAYIDAIATDNNVAYSAHGRGKDDEDRMYDYIAS